MRWTVGFLLFRMDSQTHPPPHETEIPAQTNPETETEFNQRNESSSESDHGGGVEALVGTSKPRGGNKRKPSIVWSYVTKKEFKNEFGDTDTVAICNVCKIEIPANSKRNGTTGIRNHLEKSEGSDLYKDHNSNQAMLTQDSFGGPMHTYKFDQHRLDRKCVEWVIKTEQPFKAVEHPTFKAFVNDLQLKFRIPTRKQVAKGV